MTTLLLVLCFVLLLGLGLCVYLLLRLLGAAQDRRAKSSEASAAAAMELTDLKSQMGLVGRKVDDISRRMKAVQDALTELNFGGAPPVPDDQGEERTARGPAERSAQVQAQPKAALPVDPHALVELVNQPGTTLDAFDAAVGDFPVARAIVGDGAMIPYARDGSHDHKIVAVGAGERDLILVPSWMYVRELSRGQYSAAERIDGLIARYFHIQEGSGGFQLIEPARIRDFAGGQATEKGVMRL